jgi:uncharacterized metal-binding protein YceD (DUF177 family)
MTPELTHTLRTGTITAAATTQTVTADERSRAALAVRLGIPAILALTGDYSLARGHGGTIDAQLHLKARVRLTCVVSLEPFEMKLAETERLRFVPQTGHGAPEVEALDPETLEGPDEIEFDGETIDLGEVLAEQLALALPASPRQPGAALPPAASDETAHPFAALLAFKKPE